VIITLVESGKFGTREELTTSYIKTLSNLMQYKAI